MTAIKLDVANFRNVEEDDPTAVVNITDSGGSKGQAYITPSGRAVLFLDTRLYVAAEDLRRLADTIDAVHGTRAAS